MSNIAFIDGQNLYMGTRSCDIPWQVDLNRFRVYLDRKYDVGEAYYYLGNRYEQNEWLYTKIENSGFILKFREHNTDVISQKKGNVDSDIIFHIMKVVYRDQFKGKIVLVSGDGDYKLLVDLLIKDNKFEKILLPNKDRASSLYRRLGSEYFDNLDKEETKNKLRK